MIKKRAPYRPPIKENDVYVTSKSNVGAQVQRIEKLSNNFKVVNIYALGVAIKKAVHIAYECKSKFDVDLEISSDTVTLFDDVEPLDIHEDATVQTRKTSSITIQITFK